MSNVRFINPCQKIKKTDNLLSHHWVVNYWIASEVPSGNNYVMRVLEEICTALSKQKHHVWCKPTC